MKQARISRHGGPDVIEIIEAGLSAPGPGEVQLAHTAIGLNYIDTYHRTGLYPLALPTGLGLEAAGVVTAVGAGVTDLRAGDRVAYGTGPVGAYSTARNIAAEKLVLVPEGVSDETAAAMMLKGMTARFLLKQTYPVKAGDTILVHAAAGGVGLILCQWAKSLGVTVIGTAGGAAKCALAAAHGAAHVIDYTREDVVARVREITGGKGVPVVYDGVGKDTFMKSLDCLAPRGLLVCFGNASGPVPPFDLQLLAARGSLYVTRPTLVTHVANVADLRANAADLFAAVASGAVKIEIGQRYRLEEAARAHAELEARKTTGSSVLLV
jgi:NADPH2:quinone reductase